MRAGTGGSGPMVNDGPGADGDGPDDPVGSGRPAETAGAGQSADGSGASSGGLRGHWSRWRGWRPWVKPVRRVVLLFIVALVVEYLVVPELVGAKKDLYLLNQLNAGWAVAGVVVEVVSLFCYAVLTKVLLPPGPKPSLSRLFRIDLSAAAVAHVIPAGTLGTAALGFRLFTNEGISANDAGVMMAAKGLGSTIVLNVLLWLSLVISIPLAGFRPIYGTVAIIGTVLLAAVALVIIGVTRGTERASRILHVVGDKIPWVSGDRLEAAVREASKTASAMAKDKRVLAWALVWASLNWLLDAASLWCFIAAFGVTRSVATLGVLAWRLVNFWLPIPVGAASYVSLKVKPGQGRAAMETAVSGMFAVVGARSPYATSPAAAPEPQPHSPAGPSEQETPQQPPDSAPPDSVRPADEAEEGQDRRAG
jgi:uncharacterized membrane protein YbhN (UPF0104 family)